jgi:transcriptional regulator with XRE-family HTH domain
MKAYDIQQFHAQIGPRIRSLRERSGMNRRALARALGVTPDYITRLEKGRVGVSLEMLLRLRTVLDADMEYLVCGIDLSDTTGIPPALLELWNTEDVRIRVLLADLAVSVSRFVEDPSPQEVYF